MATMALTKDTFTGAVSGPGIVLVDLWAGWCGPCKRFAPVLERANEQHPDGATIAGRDATVTR